MVSEGFQQVYEGVCRLMGAIPQPLVPDEQGQVGFGLHLGEIQVHVAATPWLAPQARLPQEGLLLMVEFDPPDGPQERGLLQALLDANLLLGAAGGPVFARNPVDGSLVLQQAFPMASVSAEHLHGMALRLAELAQAWRSGAWRMPESPSGAFSGPSAGPASGPGTGMGAFEGWGGAEGRGGLPGARGAGGAAPAYA